MSHVGDIVPYYLRHLGDINLFNGHTVGLSIIHAALSLVTCLVLLALAWLTIRARPERPENRFMFVLLVAEAYRVMVTWYNIYPFEGSPEFIELMQTFRVGWYICGLTCIMMYVCTVSFYPIKGLEFMTKPIIKNNLWWAIPSIATVAFTSLILLSPGGTVDVIGGAYHVYCAEGMTSQPAEIISSKGSPDLVGVCEDYAPYVYMVPGNSTVGQLLLVLPVFSAVIAMVFMRKSWKSLAQDPETESQAIEARSLFIGFAGKAIIKGAMVFGIVSMVIIFGDWNLADVATVSDEYGDRALTIYLFILYGFLFSILFTGMLEGFMFTYGVLKNEILGIDETLRKTFSTAIFATLGGVSLLVASELMEDLVGGGGLIGGLIVGLPLIVLRKPIFGAINNFSTVLMPEAFTKGELSYIEAYEIAMEDRIITKEERKFLKLQAKALGLDEDRIVYIESWYDSNLENEEE
jgi:hypothetical protein